MKFFCDIMLGKLAKNLRVLGIDTKYSRTITVSFLLKTAQNENRIILTRRNSLLKYNESYMIYFVTDNNPTEQLKAVIKHFHIKHEQVRIFSLCILCNRSLTNIDKSLIKGKIPDYIFNTVCDFSQCPLCKKIYWHGTHYQNALRKISFLLGETH